MNLRVSRVSQLIHGAPVGEPVANTAYVTAIMQIEDENDEMVEYRFTRQISGKVSFFLFFFFEMKKVWNWIRQLHHLHDQQSAI